MEGMSLIKNTIMETTHFEQVVTKHSLCPGDLLYNSNALAGECGEVANIVKKIRMATIRPEWVHDNAESMGMPEIPEFKIKLKDELGDAFFYLTRMALDNGLTLNDVMFEQFEKLAEQSIKYNRTFLK